MSFTISRKDLYEKNYNIHLEKNGDLQIDTQGIFELLYQVYQQTQKKEGDKVA